MTEHKVTRKAMRPASPKEECFYCSRRIDNFHKPDCVLINRIVKVRMTVEYEISIPNTWGKEEVEFQRNEGSWGSHNALDELHKIFDKRDDDECMCGATTFEYLGGNSPSYLDE